VLRIADVADDRLGGMSRTMYCTGDELTASGHTVEYLFTSRWLPNLSGSLRRCIMPLAIARHLRARTQGGERFDVVEIHEPLAAPSVWLSGRLPAFPPVVVLSYGLEERGYRAEQAYQRQKGFPVPISKRVSPLPVALQAAYAVRHSAHTICSNSADVRHLERSGVAPTRLTEHHSGVEAEFLQTEPDWAARGQPRLLFVGTWLQRKGTLDLVPAATAVMRERPGARLTVAGSGVPRETVLADFPADVRSRVHVLPRMTSNRDLIDVYQQNAILVLPSYFEGDPLVLVEAAALGLALITTNICGMADFIKPDVNGLTVAVGDTASLTRAIGRLVADPATVRRLGGEARRRAAGQTWVRAAAKIARAYEAACRQRGAQPRGSRLALGPVPSQRPMATVASKKDA
jgi:glycosyltransferase involved in cell wall biosynthesis